DLITSVQTYKLQLDQVEAALTSDPNNAELQKLKEDLNEVLTLTKNLIETQANAVPEGWEKETVDAEDIPIKQWGPGMKCSAPWSEDGQFYGAVIDSITDDGFVAVTFEGYNNTDVTKASLLKEWKPVEQRAAHSSGYSREDEKNRREHAKKRKQKKHDKRKEIEEAHEADKAKWQAFSKKKKLKGVTKKSIFATPDAADGRVGIGTCGIGGRDMTKYTTADMLRKGT
ncbi:unnamed protein product, partial [Meganyctiphanes norvegica]